MSKTNEQQAQAETKEQGIVAKGLFYLKIAAIVVIAITSLTGGYVIANSDLRNATIDFAQNQRTVQAASPKAQ